MEKWETPGTVSGRWAAISLGALLVAVAALCLVVLVSAQTPAVSVSKTVSPAEVYPDTPIQYTVVFTNETETDQIIQVISDTLPADFGFLAMAAGSGIPDDPEGTTGTIVWSDFEPNRVPAGGTLSLVYSVVANAPTFGSYDNQVEARLESGDVISDAATITLLGVEIAGDKSASVHQVRIGDPLEYEVSLTNSGNTTATLSAISDTLPAAFVFDGMVSGLPEPTVDGNELIWAGPIEIGPDDSLEFSYRVVAGGTVGESPRNSVLVAYDGETAGPFSKDVLLLESIYYVYLPLVMQPEALDLYRLAYDSYTGDNFEILTIGADGSNRFNVSDEAGGDLDPEWSPDGTKLAWVHFYEGKGDILVSNADGTGKVNVTNHAMDDRAPAWSPDGAKIVFHSLRHEGRWHVFTMNADGSDVTRLTDHLCQSHDAVWSPDGTKIAYVCGIDLYADVFVMDADGQNFARLTYNEKPDEALDWSPDSKYIAYVRYDGLARKDSEIWVVDVDTGTETQLTSNGFADYSPAWSPDGLKIAFSTYLDGSYEIAVMDADGSNVVNLTQAPKGDFVPRWSPDGLKIAFVSMRDDDRALYVMNADGSGQMRLDFIADSTDSSVHIPAWRPQ